MPTPIRLFRTVSVPEYRDLQASGTFRPSGSAEGKWFWTSRQDAGRFGEDTRGHYHPEGYRVVAVDVPTSVVSRSFRSSRLDGIGPALFVDLSDLPACSVIL